MSNFVAFLENTNFKKDVYWHYTSNDGAKAIMESGELRPSQQAVGDAVYGDGVYATKMSPKSKTKS